MDALWAWFAAFPLDRVGGVLLLLIGLYLAWQVLVGRAARQAGMCGHPNKFGKGTCKNPVNEDSDRCAAKHPQSWIPVRLIAALAAVLLALFLLISHPLGNALPV